MTTRTAITALAVTTTALGGGITAAAPASAGGIGDFLSPAFGVTCANHNNAATATGPTTQGAGTLGGNIGRLPLGSALNQCGGADLPLQHFGDESVSYSDTSKAVSDMNNALPVQNTFGPVFAPLPSSGT